MARHPGTLSAPRPEPPPLALYVHLPWCARKCPYCDFNSHPARGVIPERDYLRALQRDLEHESTRVAGRAIRTIYFGGGTPSLFSVASIAAVLDAASGRLSVTEDVEITLEANPDSAEVGRFAGYRAAGVNRVSIGVQSFDDAMLVRLGRAHDAAAARRAVRAAATTFDSFNLDLMYGLPEQSTAQALGDVEAALEADPPHLSAYQLTVEPNTAFHRDPPPLPGHDITAAMGDAVTARLASAGLERYEISAYARAGHASRHNRNYWRFGDYVGIGAGAHGKLTASGVVRRRVKPRHPRHYLREPASGEERVVSGGDLAFEFMLNALRLRSGFERDLFSRRTGLDWNAVAGPVAEGQRRGWLALPGNRVTPTAAGYRFLDDLVSLFLP